MMAEKNIIEVSDDTFEQEVLQSDTPVLLNWQQSTKAALK
jgi:hypothetical protein